MLEKIGGFAKGKKLGRPRVVVDATRIAALRRSGASWGKICEELLGVWAKARLNVPFRACPKTLPREPP